MNAQGLNAQLNSLLSTLHSQRIQNQTHSAVQLKQMEGRPGLYLLCCSAITEVHGHLSISDAHL